MLDPTATPAGSPTESRLAAIERYTSDAIVTLDAGRKVVGLNPAAEALTGWTFKEADGRSAGEVVTLLSRGREVAWDIAACGELYFISDDVRLRCRQGEEEPVTGSVHPINQADGWVVVLQGPTVDEGSAKALRESEDRFRTLADNISQLAWMADPTGWIFWYNRRWYDYTGTTFKDMEGWGWRSVHHPDYVDRVVQKVQHAWDTGEVWEDAFPLRRHDGEYRWFLSRAMPICNAGGDVIRWFGTNTDITDQRAAEEALRQANDRKNEFLAMLAHELRNPLGPIGNGLELLARLEGAKRDQVAVVRDQFSQLVRLVDDLLDVSRVMCGKIEIRKAPADLTAIARRALDAARAQTDARNQTLLAALPEEPVWTMADAVRLAQVLGNLLSNASKYSDHGAHIELSLACAGDDAVFRVRDDGVGIEPDLLPEVFGLFTQAERSIDRSQGGLGVGLTIVKQLVELHGGRVSAESVGLAGGATFTIVLPIETPAPFADKAADTFADSAAGRALRVLVVDDNVGATFMLTKLLEKLGNLSVETAHDGPTAVSKALHLRPDTVICDIGLPGMDGYEVARRLRAEPACRNAFLVALTGYGQTEHRERALAAGFDRHVVKPASIDDLEAILAAGRRAADN